MLELENPEIFRSVLESLQTGVYLVDRERKVLFWNDGAERITGYYRHEAVGHFCRDTILAHCEERGCELCGSVCPLADVMHAGKAKHSHLYFHHKNGSSIMVQVWTVPIRNAHGSLIGVAESFEEVEPVTGSYSLRDRLKVTECLDDASHLPNRESVEFHLHEALTSWLRHKLPFGILRIRMDESAHFQASHGREAVNALLRLVGKAVRDDLAPMNFMGRWADDEFVVITVDSALTGVEASALQIRNLTSHLGLHCWGDTLAIGVSIGVAIAQPDDSSEAILTRAQPAPIFSKAAAASLGPGSETQHGLKNKG